MASSKIIMLVALAILGIAISKTLAVDYVVGDDKGWTFGGDYQAWASGKKFRVGDRLIFKYKQGAHNVIRVHNDSFQACKAPAFAIALGSGHDIIPLIWPGKKQFICGFDKHCEIGHMKLSIDVCW